MKFRDLKKYLTEKSNDSAFLIEGEDSYFREKATDMLTAYAVSAYPEMNTVVLSQPSPRDIADSMSVMPFLSEKRAVIIKEYYPSAFDAEEIKKSDFDGNPQSVLIISNSQKSAPLNKLQSRLCKVDCAKEEPAVLKHWIKTIFKSYGKEIDSFIAEKLAVYCGQDMMKISNEIKKLSVLDKAEITADDIEENVSKDADYQAYMLASAMAEKKGEAYGIMKDFLSKGDAGSSMILLMSLYSSYKRMFYVKDSKTSKEKLSDILGIKPYAVTMSGKAAARFNKEELGTAMQMLADCDYYIKSGNMGADTAIYYSAARLLKKD